MQKLATNVSLVVNYMQMHGSRVLWYSWNYSLNDR